jgi:tRNA(Ile)-lysidine synthase
VAHSLNPTLNLDTSLLRPGMRLAVAVSGGADSVALLRALVQQNTKVAQNAQKGRGLGLVLQVAHLHHGLRGEEADADLAFVRDLAAQLGLPLHQARVDTAAEARARPATGKRAESIEEAARRLRYAWFRTLLSKDSAHGVDAVATAHTLDDQAETVLAKFLRGAWTEGLAGIAPTLQGAACVLRPLLGVTRLEIEAYLTSLGQPWREDSSNRHLTFTRNRIRHELLPLLETWNPQLRAHLVHMADIARDEESFWQGELARVAPQLILPGTPVRGGGRAAGPGFAQGVAVDCTRLAALGIALQRRLLRHAAGQLGVALDFAATESLRALVLKGRAGQKLTLAGLYAERTARELRLAPYQNTNQDTNQDTNRGANRVLREACTPTEAGAPYNFQIPGEIAAPAFGLRLRVEVAGASATTPNAPATAILRNWKPGDRVRLRHSSGPRKVKEVLEHLRVTGSARADWPVLELAGSIAWMQGVEVEPIAGLVITSLPLTGGDLDPSSHRLPGPSLA